MLTYPIDIMPVVSIDAQIVSTPDILNGRPRIAGHRISVRDIVLGYKYQAMGPDEIAAQFDLTLAQVFAALAYYHANLDSLRAIWAQEEDWIAKLKASIPPKVGP